MRARVFSAQFPLVDPGASHPRVGCAKVHKNKRKMVHMLGL